MLYVHDLDTLNVLLCQRFQMTKPCKQHIGMPVQDEMLKCAEPSLVEAQDQDWDMPAHTETSSVGLEN